MKLQILNNIAQQGLDILLENDFSLCENYKEVNGIVLRSHNLLDLEISNSLLAQLNVKISLAGTLCRINNKSIVCQ